MLPEPAFECLIVALPLALIWLAINDALLLRVAMRAILGKGIHINEYKT